MRCAKHTKENCEICFPRKPVSSSQQQYQNQTDNGFALGLATGIGLTPMGIVGATIHNSSVNTTDYSSASSSCSSSDSSSSSCSSSDYSSSYSNCDSSTSSFDSGGCGGF